MWKEFEQLYSKNQSNFLSNTLCANQPVVDCFDQLMLRT
jgi:hypothetical protein